MQIYIQPENGLKFNLDLHEGSENIMATPTGEARQLPICPCGYGYFIAGENHFTERHHVHQLYQVFHTISGVGHFTIGGKDYFAHADSIVLLDCTLPNRYNSHHCVWEHEWFNFFGSGACSYFNIICPSGIGILSLNGNKEVPRMISEMRLNFSRQDLAGLMHTSTRIISLLDTIYGLIVEQKRDRIDDSRANIMRSVNYIDEHYMEPLTHPQLAQLSYLSKYYYSRVFKEYIGMTPHEYLNAVRISHAQNLLISTSLSVEEIAWKTGFPQCKSFIHRFRSITGITPGQYRKNAGGWENSEA